MVFHMQFVLWFLLISVKLHKFTRANVSLFGLYSKATMLKKKKKLMHRITYFHTREKQSLCCTGQC